MIGLTTILWMAEVLGYDTGRNEDLTEAPGNQIGTCGASAPEMLQAIADGEDDPQRLAQMTRKGLRKKMPQLQLALQGRIRDHHRFLLRQLLEELTFMEQKINKLEQRIQECMRPYQHVITLWTSMPGIREVTAWSLVAEVGTNPEQFLGRGCAQATMKAQASARAARCTREIAGSAEL
jgi:hypothetical protein